MKHLFMSFYWVITMPEYEHLKFKSINEANAFRYIHNIPCKYQKRRKTYNLE